MVNELYVGALSRRARVRSRGWIAAGAGAAQLGLIALAAMGCTDDEVTESQTVASALTTRIKDGYVETNVARGGYASSSGAYGSQPASMINDGRRTSPFDAGTGQYAYWASSYSANVYNCNYNNWWVRVDLMPAPGTSCAAGNCGRTISEIDLFSLQNNYTSAPDPTTSTTTSSYGNVDFQLQYCPEGTTCTSTGSGWVVPSSGYFINNNKAWVSASFAPVRATAVRAWFHCAQSTTAYAVELEAWERNTTELACPATEPSLTYPTRDYLSFKIDSDNSTATLLKDSDRFWWRYFGSYGDTDYRYANDGISDDINDIDTWVSSYGETKQWWGYHMKAVALVQMYDLLAPIDPERALLYLERLRQLSDVLLKNRDDKRSSPPFDVLHNRVMAAWGAVETVNGQPTWAAHATMSGLLTYPLAAFARRVADHPDWFCMKYRTDAVRFTTAVLETYAAFRGDIRFGDSRNAGWWYYVNPFDPHGNPETYNEGLTPLKGLAEVASAADSELYRSSPEGQWNQVGIYRATEEVPRLIANYMKFFVDDIELCSSGNGCSKALAGTPWYWWRVSKDNYQAPEDLNHAAHTLSSILAVWDNRGALDELLARNGYAERVTGSLNSTILTGITNTFLRRIWYDDSQNPYQRSLLAKRIDGPLTDFWSNNTAPDYGVCHLPTYHLAPDDSRDDALAADNGNSDSASFVPLAKFDPWVWTRAREATFHEGLAGLPGCLHGGELTGGANDCDVPALNAGNHAALLRYRAFAHRDLTDDLVWGGPGWAIWRTASGGYLGGTSEGVSSDWSIAGVGDFNGDGSSDILWRNYDGRMQIFLMRDAVRVSTVSLEWLDPAWVIKGTTDINGDNVADIVFHHSSSRAVVAWLIGPSANVFSKGNLGGSPAGWVISGMGDFNHDGKSDLFWTLRSGSAPIQTSIWLLNGTANPGFMTLSTPTIPSSYTFKGIGHLNDKYNDDIVWRNNSGTVLTWRTTGISGSVVNITQVTTGSTGNEWDLKAVADINGDGISDFAWVRSSDRRVEGWLLNNSGGFNQSTLLGYTDPGWSIRATGNFD